MCINFALKFQVVAEETAINVTHTHTHTHTHNRFTALLEYVRDHPGEQVPARSNQEG